MINDHDVTFSSNDSSSLGQTSLTCANETVINKDEDDRSIVTTQSLPVPEHLLRRPPVMDANALRVKEDKLKQNLLKQRSDIIRLREHMREKDDEKRRLVFERKVKHELEWQEKMSEKYNKVEDRRQYVLEERKKRAEESAKKFSERYAQVVANRKVKEEQDRQRKESAIMKTESNSERAAEMKRTVGRSVSLYTVGPRRSISTDCFMKEKHPAAKSRSRTVLNQNESNEGTPVSKNANLTRSRSARFTSHSALNSQSTAQKQSKEPAQEVHSPRALARSKSQRVPDKSKRIAEQENEAASTPRESRVKFVASSDSSSQRSGSDKDRRLGTKYSPNTVKRSKSAPPIKQQPAPRVTERKERAPMPVSKAVRVPVTNPVPARRKATEPVTANAKPLPKKPQPEPSTDKLQSRNNELKKPEKVVKEQTSVSPQLQTDTIQTTDTEAPTVENAQVVPENSEVTSSEVDKAEEYKRKLAEKRRLARERAEEEEKMRLQREEEERIKQEEEEMARIDEFERKEEERRQREEEEAEERRKTREAMELKMQEEAERIELEQEQLKEQLAEQKKVEQERFQQEMEERQKREEGERAARKARLDAIMARTRKGVGASVISLAVETEKPSVERQPDSDEVQGSNSHTPNSPEKTHGDSTSPNVHSPVEHSPPNGNVPSESGNKVGPPQNRGIVGDFDGNNFEQIIHLDGDGSAQNGKHHVHGLLASENSTESGDMNIESQHIQTYSSAFENDDVNVEHS